MKRGEKITEQYVILLPATQSNQLQTFIACMKRGTQNVGLLFSVWHLRRCLAEPWCNQWYKVHSHALYLGIWEDEAVLQRSSSLLCRWLSIGHKHCFRDSSLLQTAGKQFSIPCCRPCRDDMVKYSWMDTTFACQNDSSIRGQFVLLGKQNIRHGVTCYMMAITIYINTMLHVQQCRL